LDVYVQADDKSVEDSKQLEALNAQVEKEKESVKGLLQQVSVQ